MLSGGRRRYCSGSKGIKALKVLNSARTLSQIEVCQTLDTVTVK